MNNDPRMLLIDMTSMYGPAATSMLKASYFSDWQPGRLLQLQSNGPTRLAVSANGRASRLVPIDADLVDTVLKTYLPEIIFYRPVSDHPELHARAMEIIQRSGAPLVLWLMDDWPARLETENPDLATKMDTDLRYLLKRSTLNYAISNGMAEAFGARYGTEFEVAHNGVRPEDWPPLVRKAGKDVVLRYAGSLAPDTTANAVYDTAKAVSALHCEGLPVRFEVHTQVTWLEDNEARFNALPGVTLSVANHTDRQYQNWLRGADILLLAYNFDAATRRYLQYSFANKTPELLASGAPVLVYGPDELETIRYLVQSDVAACITTKDQGALLAKVRSLVDDNALRDQLAKKARAYAFREMNIDTCRTAMRNKIRAIAVARSSGSSTVVTSDSVVLLIAPKLSIYRRMANAIAERAPLLFQLVRPMARGLKSLLRR